MSLELCFICGEATGRAGVGEDSIYDDDGNVVRCAPILRKRIEYWRTVAKLVPPIDTSQR